MPASKKSEKRTKPAPPPKPKTKRAAPAKAKTSRPSPAKAPTRAALAGWIQTPPRLGSTFAVAFAAKGDLHAFASQLAGIGDASWQVRDGQDPPTGERLELVGRTPGKRVAWVVKWLDGSWSLEAYFRESGTCWGSNQAEWLRFKTAALRALGATPKGADRIW